MRKLSSGEIERYLAAAQKLDVPPEVKDEFLTRLRAWMEADDGRAFYNLNVMRFYPHKEADNAQYEARVAPLLLKIGAYPTFAGNVGAPNLVGYGERLDNWSRIVIARYPSRRAFMNLLANPSYQDIEPLKAAALEDLLLVPVTAKLVLPNPAWFAGTACVIAFLALGWIRAARRR